MMCFRLASNLRPLCLMLPGVKMTGVQFKGQLEDCVLTLLVRVGAIVPADRHNPEGECFMTGPGTRAGARVSCLNCKNLVAFF